jgi:hypothetical protein
MPKRIVINEYMDLEWYRDRPTVFVNGEPFQQCSFLAVTAPPEKLGRINDIDHLVSFSETRALEGRNDIDKYLHDVGNLDPEEHITEEEIMQAHASNLIAWAENDYNTRILNSNISFPLLKELARAGDQKARRVLQSEIVERLKEDYENTSIVILETCKDVMDAASIDVASRSRIEDVRKVAASLGSAPPSMLDRMSKEEESEDVLMMVVSNANTPQSALVRLAENDDAGVRRIIAMNKRTPDATLVMLARDDDDFVRIGVALSNKDIPLRLIEDLADDKDDKIRRAIAMRHDTPLSILEQLASDEDWVVRLRVAQNENTSGEVLNMLLGDDVKDVRDGALAVIGYQVYENK